MASMGVDVIRSRVGEDAGLVHPALCLPSPKLILSSSEALNRVVP